FGRRIAGQLLDRRTDVERRAAIPGLGQPRDERQTVEQRPVARLGAVEFLLLLAGLAMSSHHEPSENDDGQSPDAGGSGDPPRAVGDEHEGNASRAEEGETDGGGEPGTGS